MQNKPFLSLKERDRRYKLVRQAMRERGLDALLIWGHSGKWDWHMANIHYMSLVGGNGEEGFLDNSMGVRMGDTVLVTRDGRRRLGTKEPKIVICK